MSMTVFVDHSLLRRAAQGEFAEALSELKALVRNGSVKFVSSLYQLGEIAKFPECATNFLEAELIDSLRPLWLRTRSDLIRAELLNAFLTWRGEPEHRIRINPLHATPLQYGALGQGVRFLQKGQHSARTIVDRFQQMPILLGPVMEAEGYTSFRCTLAEFVRSKKIDSSRFAEIARIAVRKLISNLAPTQDQGGAPIRAAQRRAFIQEVKPEACPSLAVDTIIFQLRLDCEPPPHNPTDREFRGVQYAECGLPYLDVMIFDQQFSDLARQAARRCESVRAVVFSEFQEAVDCLMTRSGKRS